MRKKYLDNLRTVVILLLFLVHTFMIYNNFGTKFYIWNGENRMLSTLIVIINPWFMPLLFVIAGISTKYSLEKRTSIQYIKERFNRLFIPFLSGIILLVPIQTFYARKFFYKYSGNYLENIKYFFTHLTNFSGYDGKFTPGQLWFILFLFIISIVSVFIFKIIKLENVKSKIDSFNLFTIICLFIPIWLFYYIGNLGGFSLGKSLILFLIGYYILSNENIIQKLEKNKNLIMCIYLLSTAILAILYYKFKYYDDLFVNFITWIGILSWMLIGKKYFNFSNKFSQYMKNNSYLIYILHQSILVSVAYYVLRYTSNIFCQVTIIIFLSFTLSLIFSYIIRKIPVVNKLFGVK